MEEPSRPTKDSSGWLLALVAAGVVGSFIALMLFAQHTSEQVDLLADRIAQTRTPSIERLASLRASVFTVELSLSEFLHADPRTRTSLEVETSLEALRRNIAEYLRLPAAPGEPRHWIDIQKSAVKFEQVVKRTVEFAEEGDDPRARGMFVREVEPAGNEMLDRAAETIEFNAQSARMLAAEIKEARKRTIQTANGLGILFILLCVSGALLIHSQARARRSLFEAYSRFLEERGAELEKFAGRVAHDLRNPLSAASVAVELARKRTSDEDVRSLLDRVIGGLSRADALISGLLDFARAGARPDPGARTDVAATIADMTPALRETTGGARIELVVEEVPSVLVACNTGVYLSLLGNLVRNAVKYMGDSRERKIVIRVSRENGQVKTEVRDTGPGIPEEALPSIFEPYFRGPTAGQAGLGLGLATVKKLAEGHGGSVGATSVRGAGSVFWFTLPLAGSSFDTSG